VKFNLKFNPHKKATPICWSAENNAQLVD